MLFIGEDRPDRVRSVPVETRYREIANQAEDQREARHATQDDGRTAGAVERAQHRRRRRGTPARRRAVARAALLRSSRKSRDTARASGWPNSASWSACTTPPPSTSPKPWSRWAICGRSGIPSVTASAGRCLRSPPARSTKSRWSISRRRCWRICRGKPARAGILRCAWAIPSSLSPAPAAPARSNSPTASAWCGRRIAPRSARSSWPRCAPIN